MNKIITKFVAVALSITLFAGTAQASVLSLGSRGGEVSDLQITLIEAGYDIPAITVGKAPLGYYGVQTDKAYQAYKASRQILGAVSTLNLVDSPEVSIGGAREKYVGMELAPGTSTPCTIKSPSVPSSLRYTSLKVTTPLVGAGSSAINWDLATSTVPNATTTPFHGFVTTESSSPLFTVVATSTVGTQTLLNLAANTYITWSLTGTTTTTGTTYLRGHCQAVFANN